MKLHERVFSLFIILLPVQLGYHFWPNWSHVFGIRVDYLAPTLYLTDLIFLLTLLLWGKDKLQKTGKKRVVLGFFVLAVVSSISLIVAENKGISVFKTIKLLELFLLGVYVSENHSLTANRTPLAIAVSYSVFIAIIQFLRQGAIGGVFWFLGERNFTSSGVGVPLASVFGLSFIRPPSVFSHPNSFAGFLLVACLFLFFGKKSTIYFSGLILGMIGILLSFSRATWATLFLLVIFFLISRKTKVAKKLLKAIFLLVLLLSFLTPLGAYLKSDRQYFYQRISLSSASLKMIRDYPLAGVGFSNFIPKLPDYYVGGGGRVLQPVHNIYLLITAEAGILGLSILLVFIFKTLKKVDRKEIVLPLALLTIMVTGFFDHYWITLQQNQLLAALVLGSIWGKKR